jgi:hypothetical protein
MDASEFWNLIETSAREADGRVARAEWLVTRLAAGPVGEIVGFEQVLDEQTTAAMTWLMWGAADRIMGWCSDDSFIDFRAWLVGLGRKTFQAVVADPDVLAEVPEVRRLAGRYHGDWAEGEWPAWESLEYAASHAYERVTGDEDGFHDLVPRPEGEILTDERWDFRDPREAARRLPRLTRLFPREER